MKGGGEEARDRDLLGRSVLIMPSFVGEFFLLQYAIGLLYSSCTANTLAPQGLNEMDILSRMRTVHSRPTW